MTIITTLIAFLVSATKFGMVLLFGSTGETVTEKSGHLNLGLPGVMCVGTACGCVAEALLSLAVGGAPGMKRNSVLAILVPIIATLIGSALMGLLFSFLTVTLHANQNVTGLAMTTLGVGISNYMIATLKIYNAKQPSLMFSTGAKYFREPLPLTDKIADLISLLVEKVGIEKLGVKISEFGTRIADMGPSEGASAWIIDKTGMIVNAFGWLVGNIDKAIEEVILSYGIMFYLAIAIAIVTAIVLNKTKIGLHLRSVGENPATADAAGINVTRYRYLATCIGCAISGLGGLMFVMDYLNGNWEYMIDAIGWLCVALVIFTTWKPIPGIFCSLIFGAFYVAAEYIPGISFEVKEIFKMLPYVVTIIVLIITSIRNKKENQPPASLGLPYFREDR